MFHALVNVFIEMNLEPDFASRLSRLQ